MEGGEGIIMDGHYVYNTLYTCMGVSKLNKR